MTANYRLFGAETSAYSTKIRSFMRYKGVEFTWVPRTSQSEGELRRLSRFATLPVLVTESGYAVHDTTPMIEALEADTPEPSALPDDPALSFLASVLEEFADTWLAKAAYTYRWTRKKDQKQAATRAIDEYFTDEQPDDRKAMEKAAIERMEAELGAIGLDGELGNVVEKSFKKFIKLLNDHLRKHLYLFGGRPSIADFAIGGQLIQMMKDPTPAKIIEKDGEFVAKWCEFLEDPKPGGPFEALADLEDTLGPIFAGDLSKYYMPWAAENLESSLAGAEDFSVVLAKDNLSLKPLRSAARSFRELRRKFVKAQEIEELKAFTDKYDSTSFLLRPASVGKPQRSGRDDDSSASGDNEAEGGDDEGKSRKRRRRRRGRSSEGREAQSASSSNEDSEASDDSADDTGDDN